MIPLLAPPQAPLEQLIHGPVSPPVLAPARNADLVYGMCTVGEAGRVVDRTVLAALGWTPGVRLEIRCDEQAVLVVTHVGEGSVVVRDGFFRVPYRLRRRVGLFVGDRVLLVGTLSRNRLAICPPAAMADLVAPILQLLQR